MAEELAKSIVEAAHIMEQNPKMTKIITLDVDLTSGTYQFCPSHCVANKDELRYYTPSFNSFAEAYNRAVSCGYVPLENSHPASQMLSKIQHDKESRTHLGAFMKKE